MPETLKLSVRRLLGIYGALNSLDGVRVGKDEVVPLEFSGAVRAKIMMNVVAIEPVREAHEGVERAMAKQCGVFDGMDKTPENAAKVNTYNQAVAEALDMEREVEVVRISLKELLEKPGDGKGAARLNAIPQSLLNRLTPILDFA